jgi:hypothetical protein
MLVSPTGLTSTTDPVDEPKRQAPLPAPSAEASSTEALITAQQVLFSTAAAVGVHRDNVGARIVAVMRRMFATSTNASRPRRQDYPKRYGFLEDACMARAMERL